MLGCKVGPLFPIWKKKLKKLKTSLIINPDGLEWKREKWSWWIKKCFKISERYCIKYSDYCVCDSASIESYIKQEYQNYHTPTKFIAFGAYENRNPKKSQTAEELFQKYQIKEKEYYLIVGRFIPENNYEIMIREFMKTNTKKKLVIISNVEENKFYEELKEKTKFDQDNRIKFVGTVYDEQLLTQIRQNAYGYIHGHEVGGTNPSLLEALATTRLNLLLEVGFNKEVAKEGAVYWNKTENNLRDLLNYMEQLEEEKIEQVGNKAKQRIEEEYSWEKIVKQYEEIF